MKKLALILAIVMVACFMFVACEKAPEDENSTGSTPASTQGNTGSEQGENPNPSTPDQPTSTPDTPNTPAGQEVWQDFSSVASKGKGTEFSEQIGIFNIVRGKVATSGGKTVKEGTKTGTSFTGAVQLGKNGSATDKCITFTVPEGLTTLELYVYSASSDVDGDFNVSVNGTVTAYPCSNANITCVTITVKGGDAIALYGGAAVSTNIWGILVK